MNKLSPLFLALALTTASVVQAEEPVPSPAPAQTAKVTATRADCERVMIDAPPAAGVEYQPGVDAYGNPVAGADATDYSALLAAIPKTFEFDLTFKPVKTVDALKDSSMSTGKIAYDMNTGRMSYNGVGFTDSQTEALIQACREMAAKP